MKSFLSPLPDSSSIRVVKKGANLLFQGEIPRHAFIVRDGLIRSYTITSAGEERIIGLHDKGAILPLSWIFGKTSNSLFYYDAVIDSRVAALNKSQLIDHITSDRELTAQAMTYLASENTASLLRINGLEQTRAIEKIGFTLYYLLFRHGQEKTPGKFIIELKLSQLMLANLVGLTRESTTKNLNLLKDKGVIDYASSTYTIDKAKLEAFLGEDSFRDLSI